MAEFEVERPMPLPAETVFAVASDVAHMAEWLPMTVEPAGPNRLHVEGETRSGRYSASGLFGVRPEQRRVEWGSEDSDDYAGWLQVFEAGDGKRVRSRCTCPSSATRSRPGATATPVR